MSLMTSKQTSIQVPNARTRRAGNIGARARRAAASMIVLVVAVTVWWLLSVMHVFPQYALPSPGQVWNAFLALQKDGFGGQSLGADIRSSLYRIAVGFLLAAAIGIPLGIGMGRSRVLFHAIDPLVEFFRPVPPLAYIPLLVVWFGIDETPKIVLIAAGTAPIIIINSMSGVRSIPPVRLRVAECLGATRWQMFFRVVLPSALPEIFTGLRVANGVAWTCLVAAELIAADSGLGWLVQSAGQALRVSIVIVGIVLIGIFGYATEILIRVLEQLFVPWKGKA
jgi:ABC-type nitrate/sulfonate/bicarbonate transport system permease component